MEGGRMVFRIGWRMVAPKMCAFSDLAEKCATVVFGNIRRTLCLEREADHHGKASTDGALCPEVDSLLLQGEALLPDVTNTRFHHDLVVTENRLDEVCVDIGNDRHHILLTIVFGKHVVEVILLAQIIIGEVGVVIYVPEAVHVVEPDLYGQPAPLAVVLCIFFHAGMRL